MFALGVSELHGKSKLPGHAAGSSRWTQTEGAKRTEAAENANRAARLDVIRDGVVERLFGIL